MPPTDARTPPERPAKRRKAKRRPPQLRSDRPTIRREARGFSERTTVLLEADLYEALVRFAQAERITLPEAIRRSAREGLTTILERVEDAAMDKALREFDPGAAPRNDPPADDTDAAE